MTEFQELVKDAPKFELMERGELVAYAYAMHASGARIDAENAKLRELLNEAEHFHSLEEEQEAIAEYAKRLTLAEGEDA